MSLYICGLHCPVIFISFYIFCSLIIKDSFSCIFLYVSAIHTAYCTFMKCIIIILYVHMYTVWKNKSTSYPIISHSGFKSRNEEMISTNLMVFTYDLASYVSWLLLCFIIQHCIYQCRECTICMTTGSFVILSNVYDWTSSVVVVSMTPIVSDWPSSIPRPCSWPGRRSAARVWVRLLTEGGSRWWICSGACTSQQF